MTFLQFSPNEPINGYPHRRKRTVLGCMRCGFVLTSNPAPSVYGGADGRWRTIPNLA